MWVKIFDKCERKYITHRNSKIEKTKCKCHLQILDYTEYKGCRDAYIKRNSFYNKISLFCFLQDLKHGNSGRTNLFFRIKGNFTGENEREVRYKT